MKADELLDKVSSVVLCLNEAEESVLYTVLKKVFPISIKLTDFLEDCRNANGHHIDSVKIMAALSSLSSIKGDHIIRTGGGIIHNKYGRLFEYSIAFLDISSEELKKVEYELTQGNINNLSRDIIEKGTLRIGIFQDIRLG